MTKNNIFNQAKTWINSGVVFSSGDGVAKVYGLTSAACGELVSFTKDGSLNKKKIFGIVLNLEKNTAGIVFFNKNSAVSQGDLVHSEKTMVRIPVGFDLLGKAVDSLGNPVDGSNFKPKLYFEIERKSPGLILRKAIDKPVQTGVLAIDSMFPIGRGQRELFIGDRGTGKTTILIDTILNLIKKKHLFFCVYVAIGQKCSSITRIFETLKKAKVLNQSIVISASVSEPASLQYLSAYSGCTIAEFFRDLGLHSLIVYDDLSQQAVAYRQVSLLLRRPPSRDAYPGDIFYLHSKLLERASNLKKGGSLTALPVIETQAGDISAYIPTNVISITDGQIFFEKEIFYKGIRPAISIGLSVSRVGSAAQVKAMKQISGTLKLDLALFREVAIFANFEAELDKTTFLAIKRGTGLIEILKQNKFVHLSVKNQIILLGLGTLGWFDLVPTNDVTNLKNFVNTVLVKIFWSLLKNFNIYNNLTQKKKNILKNQLGIGIKYFYFWNNKPIEF